MTTNSSLLTTMASSFRVSGGVVLFVCMLCFLSICPKVMPQQPFSYNCPNTTVYNPNSTYRANLNFLLSTLTSNATVATGFYNFTAGRDPPNIAYGLFLCRGDVTPNDCQQCVTTASREILQLCPNRSRSIVWYDKCLLRFSNQPVVSISDQSIRIAAYNTQNITDQVEKFKQLLGEMMNEIATEASNDQSGKKIGTKQANFTALQTLYGLVQCTPDLTGSDCNTCLRDAISTLPSCCDGKRGARVLFPSCYVRYETYPFFQSVARPPPPPPPPARPPPPSSASSDGKRGISSQIIAAIGVPIAFAILVFITGFCFLTRKAKKTYNTITEETETNEIVTVESLQYDLRTIQTATNNFSDENKIGEGGFGDVYKGTLPSGQEVAVKRLSKSSRQGAEEFKNEVVLVAKLQHRNLVRLLGFCLEGEEKILLYEYVPNRSLDFCLFDPEKQGQLDWSRRYKIIGGIARGILYLHEDSQFRIIHRDLKASNILLDGDMNAKISDFGMARLFGSDQSQGNTSKIVGTYGYMSPEYAMHGQFSVKSDVFSFGVLVLEILTGKKNSSFYQSNLAEDLLSYAWKQWRDGTPLELMDPSLGESYNGIEVSKCIHIGLLCVQEDMEDRPTMASIILMLNSNSVTMPVPHKPAFYLHSKTGSSMPKDLDFDQSTTKSIPLSVNEISITELYPR